MSEIPGKLRWRCRRGSKELDLLLLRALEHPQGYAALPPADQQRFETLLQADDRQWQAWWFDGEPPENPDDARVVQSLYRAATHPA